MASFFFVVPSFTPTVGDVVANVLPNGSTVCPAARVVGFHANGDAILRRVGGSDRERWLAPVANLRPVA